MRNVGIYWVCLDVQSYGYEIGILLIVCFNFFLLGDVGNVWSYNYLVLYEMIYDVIIDSLINEGDCLMVFLVVVVVKKL